VSRDEERVERILAARAKSREKQLKKNEEWRAAHPDWPVRPSDAVLKELLKKAK
jgi:hypothetical protein